MPFISDLAQPTPPLCLSYWYSYSLAKANSFQFLAVHQGFSLALTHSVFYVYRAFPPSVHPAAPRSFFQPLQAVPPWCCSNQACVLLQHSSLCFVHVYLLWSLTRLWTPPGFSGSGWMTEWINRFQHLHSDLLITGTWAYEWLCIIIFVRKKFTLQLAVPCYCGPGADCTGDVHSFIYSAQVSNEAGIETVLILRRRVLRLHSVQSLAPGYI